MKILILLFVVATACGQTHSLQLDNSTTLTFKCITPEDLDSYLQDCYNDSSWVVYPTITFSTQKFESKTFLTEKSAWRYHANTPNTSEPQVIHREATLQGFSQWMKGRK